MRVLPTLILIALPALCAPAELPTRCVSCQSPITGRYLWIESPVSAVRQSVCEPCSHLESRCAICSLPFLRGGRNLEDGRWLCQADLAAGIFSATEALLIYMEARRDVEGILAGSGPMARDNVNVSLIDGAELRKVYQTLPSLHEEMALLGVTRTRVSPGQPYQHSIYLINGLGRARLAAVSAHEYTHTWLHENLPADRRLDRDTIEGFCELVAYKVMTLRREEAEKRVILANAYSRGQVNAFVQAETTHQFHRVVRWVKTGVDEVLPRADSSPVLDLGGESPAPLPWPPPAPVATAVPDTLTLKGITGGRARRFVLINDCTLGRNEEGRVRLGTSNLVVRCLEIRERSAVIQVKGSGAITELFMGGTTGSSVSASTGSGEP